MRLSVIFVLVSIFIVSPMFAQSADSLKSTVPAQLTGLEITHGYNLMTSVFFKGKVTVIDNQPAKGIFVFVNNFSTKVTPEGEWAIYLPLRSFFGDKATPIIARVRAIQEQTNVVVEKPFNFSNLRKQGVDQVKFSELYE